MKNIKDIIGELGIELDEAKLGDLEKAVLENYRTVAEVENKQSRISELEQQLATANEALEAAKNADVSNADEVQAMRDKIAAYEKADEERKAQTEEEKARQEFDEKFVKTVGDKQFVNDIVRGAVADKAYAIAKANPDMDVAAILGGIVGDAEGVWQNPQQTVKKMPAASGNGGSAAGTQTIQNIEDLKGMSVEEIRAHMDEVNKVLSNQK
ncbi:MAG: minor structural protein [Bacteriophage sp.]|nr:MAG: minor structural protein [Bacteriophage sp.]UVX36832.1 MAG: minor structural protein [Bacteriophage sp.]UVX53660.1 MAG: minor structural protein [Bacteriophage sp.]UVX75429.1 MAG: minor structural protein [Bacteriophage sp.]DAQ01453.1 MAG TPA: A-type inclusion protein repeat protein [Caudoviricetes sp.]